MSCPDLDEVIRYNREAKERVCEHRQRVNMRYYYYCRDCQKRFNESEDALLCGRELAKKLKLPKMP